jgi:hypothetical protein
MSANGASYQDGVFARQQVTVTAFRGRDAAPPARLRASSTRYGCFAEPGSSFTERKPGSRFCRRIKPSGLLRCARDTRQLPPK